MVDGQGALDSVIPCSSGRTLLTVLYRGPYDQYTRVARPRRVVPKQPCGASPPREISLVARTITFMLLPSMSFHASRGSVPPSRLVAVSHTKYKYLQSQSVASKSRTQRRD